MSDITIVQILNEIDQIQYILYTEWKSTCFKIMLFKSSAVPLTGEMPENDINYYSQEHSKSFNEYLKETKDIFSGKNTDIQYFFQDNKFEWRRNKRWILGKITIFPISNIVLISEILYDILKQQQHLQKVISELRKENDLLKDNNKELSFNIEEMIEMKTNMEKELYKKFILILNAKKKKIRELEDSLKNTKYEQKSLFDVSTDQSEDSDTDDKSAKNIELHVGKPISYRCMNKNKDSDKKSKKSFYVPHKGSKLNSRSIVNEMEATTSRTTEKQNYFDSIRNEKMKSVSRTSSKSSNDSEDEFELRLSETCTDKHNLDFTEELEEELFS